jgi:hypothetical protein
MPGSPFTRAALVASLLAVLALALPANVRAASRNLLVNPGFEDGLPDHPWMPAGWDTSVSGLNTAFFGRDTFLVHSGRYSVNVANVSRYLPIGFHWSQTVLVGREAWGKDLLFTVWTRSNGVDGGAYCILQAYRDTISKMAKVWGISRDDAATRLKINSVDDPLTQFGWRRVVFKDRETPWVKREMRLYCPPGANVVFVRCGVTGTGQLVVDDASLTLENALPAPSLRAGENLLQDPGFEGDGSSWEYSTPPFAGLTVERDTLLSHAGRACMHFRSEIGPGIPAAPVKARMGVCQVVLNRALGGKRLKLSAWVKTDSLQGVAYLKLYGEGQYGMVQGIASEQFSENTPWTRTEQVLDLPPDTYSVWAWCLYDAPVPGDVYFDDARLEVVGPVPPPPAIPKPRSKGKS